MCPSTGASALPAYRVMGLAVSALMADVMDLIPRRAEWNPAARGVQTDRPASALRTDGGELQIKFSV